MCETCGCSDGSSVRVEAADGGHLHLNADGSVVKHTHPPGEHEHVNADGSVVKHTHPPGEHEHVNADGSVVKHTHPPAGAPPHTEQLAVKVLQKNDVLAARNRGYLAGREVLAVNLMSSPGSGKTTLLERTLKGLGLAVSVLEGDQETSNDAERIRAAGAKAVQINTGKGCHLEADMVWHGLGALAPPQGSVVFIENVGNLVCPALFDLGEDLRAVLFSVTEGEDKPLKYPFMFQAADLVLLTKIDLLPHLDFDLPKALAAVKAVAPRATILQVSSRSGEGLEAWKGWLHQKLHAKHHAPHPAAPQS